MDISFLYIANSVYVNALIILAAFALLWGAAAFRLSGLLFKDVAGRLVDVTGLGSELILSSTTSLKSL